MGSALNEAQSVGCQTRILHQRRQQRIGRENGRAVGETLACRSRRVAQGVQCVCVVPHSGGHFGHLGNATCVIGHGAVGVRGHRDSERRKHADGRQCNAVGAEQLIRAEDDGAHQHKRDDDRQHANAQSLDDHRARTVLARARDTNGRAVRPSREVLREGANEDAQDQPEYNAKE